MPTACRFAYGIWCQVFGCLGIYDFEKGEYVGMLADRWEVDKTDNNVWTFHLKRGVKRHNDGRNSPPTTWCIR